MATITQIHQCDQCMKVFKNKSSIKPHMKICKGAAVIPIDTCIEIIKPIKEKKTKSIKQIKQKPCLDNYEDNEIIEEPIIEEVIIEEPIIEEPIIEPIIEEVIIEPIISVPIIEPIQMKITEVKTSTETVTYTNDLYSGTFKTINAIDYETIATELNCYEMIPDNIPVKMLFDIDYKKPINNKDEEEFCPEIDDHLIERATSLITEVLLDLNCETKLIPHFCIKTSHSPDFVKCNTSSPEHYWAMSIHIIVVNYILEKRHQKTFISKFNEAMNLNRADWKDYMMGCDKIFDESIYSPGKQKIRAVYSSKPNENRPFILKRGTFKDSVISAFIPDDVCHILVAPELEEEKPKHINISANVVSSTDNDKTYKLVEKLIDTDLLVNCAATNQTNWSNFGCHLKTLFDDEKAFALFEKLTLKHGSDNKKEEYSGHFKYIKPKTDDKVKALNVIKKHARDCDPEKYKTLFIQHVDDTATLVNINCFENTDFKNILDFCIIHPTDVMFAEAIAKIFGENHVCCSIKEKWWYLFDKKLNIWKPDECLKIRSVISNDFCDLFKEELNILMNKSLEIEKTDPKHLAFQKKINQVNNLINVLRKTTDKDHILRELQEQLIDPLFLKDMNKELYMLPIKGNKMLNMNTLELTERTTEHKFDFICDAEYLTEMNPDREAFVGQYYLDLFCGDKALLQIVLNILKSSLTGKVLRYIIFHIGDGSNGKSTLFNALQKIFPSRIMDVISKDVIITKKSNSHLNTEFEKLEHCRLAFVTELKDTDVLNIENIKAISGGDKIDVRSICKTNISIHPTSTCHIPTNVLASFKVHKAILKRIVLIPYKADFKTDTKFEDKLMTYTDEIFTFIMKYGVVCDNFDDANLTPEMVAMKQQYADDNEDDYLKEFINDRIEFVAGGRLLRDEFRVAYNNWCGQFHHSIDKSTNTKFTRVLKDKHHITSKESNSKVYYLGIRWKGNNECENEDP